MVPRTHTVEGKNCLLQVVPWPPWGHSLCKTPPPNKQVGKKSKPPGTPAVLSPCGSIPKGDGGDGRLTVKKSGMGGSGHESWLASALWNRVHASCLSFVHLGWLCNREELPWDPSMRWHGTREVEGLPHFLQVVRGKHALISHPWLSPIYLSSSLSWPWPGCPVAPRWPHQQGC